MLKDGALHPVEGTAYAFNNSAQVVALRACQIPGSSYLGSTIFPATPGGPNVDAVEVLPHFGLVGRDSSYRFTDPNQPRNGRGKLLRAGETGVFFPSHAYGVAWDASGNSVGEVLADVTFNLVNNKNPFFGLGVQNGVPAKFIHLPEPDYGLPAGLY